MNVGIIKNRLTVFFAATIVLTASLSGMASAHVTVKPAEVATSSYQIFTVSVPNEKSVSTTGVKLLIPDSIKTVTPTQKAGWQIEIEKESSGDDVVKSVAWSGGEISDGTRDDFTFSARVPSEATELEWKAYQTYSDGTVVAWDQVNSDSHGHDSASGNPNQGPLSVTKVVNETDQATSAQKAEQAATNAKNAADRATYIAIAGAAVGLLAVFLATRRNK